MAGSSSPTKTPMIATTTRISTSENPARARKPESSDRMLSFRNEFGWLRIMRSLSSRSARPKGDSVCRAQGAGSEWRWTRDWRFLGELLMVTGVDVPRNRLPSMRWAGLLTFEKLALPSRSNMSSNGQRTSQPWSRLQRRGRPRITLEFPFVASQSQIVSPIRPMATT